MNSQSTATQQQLDAMTYEMYLDCARNAAETARQQGIAASTVTRRVRREALRRVRSGR
jgi:hypothetical protein